MKFELVRASDGPEEWDAEPVYVEVDSIATLKELAGEIKKIQVNFRDNTITVVDDYMD